MESGRAGGCRWRGDSGPAPSLRPASWVGPSAAFPSRARGALQLWPWVFCLQTLRSWNAASALVRVDPLRAECSLLPGFGVCTGIGVGGRGCSQMAALLQLALDGGGPQGAEEAECGAFWKAVPALPQPQQARGGGGGAARRQGRGASCVRLDSASEWP